MHRFAHHKKRCDQRKRRDGRVQETKPEARRIAAASGGCVAQAANSADTST
jgi:hypothetical protein